jgi:uncharacterized protein YdhG (YjbR/CyaY superfamily)
MTAVDEYLAGLDEPVRLAFAGVLGTALEVVPDAEQGRSYGMAALRHRGKPLLGFLATKQHLSLFPFSTEVVDAVRDRLVGFDLSKGTIRFSVDKPLPDDVVRSIVLLRAQEIVGRTSTAHRPTREEEP